MAEIAITKFKATCLAVLENVRRTGEPVTVTRFGEAVAEIVPSRSRAGKRRKHGGMVGTGRIVGDIVGSTWEETDWEPLV